MSIDINKHLPNFVPSPTQRLSAALKTADVICDYVPGISTVSNLTDIFLKAVVIPRMDMTKSSKNTYYSHLNNKPVIRCILGAIPILGNITLIIYDIKKHINKIDIIREIKTQPLILRNALKEIDYYLYHNPFESVIKYLDQSEMDEIILETSAYIANNHLSLDTLNSSRSSYAIGVWDLQKKHREDWNFLKKALSQNPELATSKRFWFGCLAYTQDDSFHEKAALMDHFIKDNKDFYIDVLIDLIISKRRIEIRTEIIKNKEFIKFACNKLSQPEKSRLTATILGTNNLLSKTNECKKILDYIDLDLLESLLNSNDIGSRFKLPLQYYVFQKGGSVKVDGFFEKIIESYYKKEFDVDFNAKFWRSAYLSNPLITKKIPRLLSNSAFLMEAFLVDPQLLKDIYKVHPQTAAIRIFLEATKNKQLDNFTLEHKRALALAYPKPMPYNTGYVPIPREIYEELIQIGSSNHEEDLKVKENYFFSYIAFNNPIIDNAMIKGVSIYFGKKPNFTSYIHDECCLSINPDTYEPEWYARFKVLKGKKVVEEEKRYPGTKNLDDVKRSVREELLMWEARIREHEREEQARADYWWQNYFHNQKQSRPSSTYSSESQSPFLSILEMIWRNEKKKYDNLTPDPITATDEYGIFKARFFTSKTPHELLGLGSNADGTSIRNAYKKYSKVVHPDKNKEKELEASALFAILNSAYELIQK